MAATLQVFYNTVRRRRADAALAVCQGPCLVRHVGVCRHVRRGGDPSVERLVLVGLLDKLSPLLRTAVPEPVRVSEGDPQAICAPVSGQVVALEEVGDPAFSQGMLGRGFGIVTEGDVAFSPVSGTVMADVKTGHALLIRADSGAEVLLHVGLDSVRLNGSGFRTFAHKGDHVRAGQPLIAFDRRLMAERGLDDTVLVTVTNAEDLSCVEERAASGGKVAAGAVVMRAER